MPNRRELGYVSAGSTSTVLVSTGNYGRATGGIGSPTAVTINSVNYEYLTFNATGTLTVTTAGFFDYLAVGGGTGNQNESGYPGGAGGSGAVVIGTIYLSADATVTIGAGSATAANITTQRTAGDTTINAPSPFAVVAVGSQSVGAGDGNITGFVAGGSGHAAGGTTQKGLNNIAAGYRGGKTDGVNAAGGGGGFSAVGGNGVSNTGGDGGAGFDVSVFIGGSSLFKASGAGGGGATTGGVGGSSLGNNGTATTTPVSGGANTGCGGGGGKGVTTTGAGGSGICYIRYKV